MEHVNDDELVLSSSGVVLKVNKREFFFYKTMRDLVERTYKRSFHSQYKNQCNDFNNEIIFKQ